MSKLSNNPMHDLIDTAIAHCLEVLARESSGNYGKDWATAAAMLLDKKVMLIQQGYGREEEKS